MTLRQAQRPIDPNPERSLSLLKGAKGAKGAFDRLRHQNFVSAQRSASIKKRGKMRNLICIVCPIGCALDIDDSKEPDKLLVTGNKCQRGIVYATEEIRAPKRVVTATAQINENNTNISIRRVPVKTVSPCPKEKIPALLQEIYKLNVKLPVKTGDILISNCLGEGINVVATRTIN